MKFTILTILFLYLSLHAESQSTATGQQIIKKKCGSDHARLSLGKYGRGYPDLFSEIRVLDARPDTSRIGIVRTGISGQRQILLDGAVAAQLTGYLNSTYARPKASHSLLIVLKSLWIACPDDLPVKWRPVYPTDFNFHVEAYLQAKDGFMPLVSMDTTLHYRQEDAALIVEDQTRELFDEFMNRLASGDLDKERRIVSARQIDSFNRIPFDYPMDTATKLVKGAYRTVEEFLNNAPSIENAEFSTGKGGYFELSIPDENGKMFYTHTVWGYCDGAHAYVMMDGTLFAIFSIHHQFYVVGAKEFYENSGSATSAPTVGPGGTFMPNTPGGGGGLVRPLRLFRIDTRDGKVTE